MQRLRPVGHDGLGETGARRWVFGLVASGCARHLPLRASAGLNRTSPINTRLCSCDAPSLVTLIGRCQRPPQPIAQSDSGDQVGLVSVNDRGTHRRAATDEAGSISKVVTRFRTQGWSTGRWVRSCRVTRSTVQPASSSTFCRRRSSRKRSTSQCQAQPSTSIAIRLPGNAKSSSNPASQCPRTQPSRPAPPQQSDHEPFCLRRGRLLSGDDASLTLQDLLDEHATDCGDTHRQFS
jgi:hypothetical protein